MNLFFCGDIMPGGVLEYQESYVSQDVLEYLAKFDYRIGTLECALGNDEMKFDTEKMSDTCAIIYAKNSSIFRVKQLGINAVSLANNHVMDLGKEGLFNTIQILDDNGILHFGAGRNVDEAKRPIVIKTADGKSVAIIGCLFQGVAPKIYHEASKTEAGVYRTSIDEIYSDIKCLKKQYDFVVVMPHWAKEFSTLPPAYCKTYVRRMVDAGVDLVIGSHPHIINPVVSLHGVPIFYSLGNFLFPDICLAPPRPMSYPDTLSNLKRVWAYPKRIKDSVISVGKGSSRIGMSANVLIDSSVSSTYQLFALHQDNTLHLFKGFGYKVQSLRLSFYAFCMHLPFYSTICRFYLSKHNVIRKWWHSLLDVMGVSYDVKVSLD